MPEKKVNHPEHYHNPGDGTSGKFEAIKVIEAWGLLDSFCLGNVLKYVSRAEKHGAKLKDLKKAQWYLDREIERLERVKTEE